MSNWDDGMTVFSVIVFIVLEWLKRCGLGLLNMRVFLVLWVGIKSSIKSSVLGSSLHPF